jgi:hypothetical protein
MTPPIRSFPGSKLPALISAASSLLARCLAEKSGATSIQPKTLRRCKPRLKLPGARALSSLTPLCLLRLRTPTKIPRRGEACSRSLIWPRISTRRSLGFGCCGLGSVAFGALARVVMVAARQHDSEDGKRGPRVLMRAKSNVGPDDGGFNYELQLVPMRERPDILASVVSWGESVEGNGREILAAAESMDDDGEVSAFNEARRRPHRPGY